MIMNAFASMAVLNIYFMVICSSSFLYETLEPTTTESLTTYNSFTLQWKPYFCSQTGYSDAPNCYNESIPNITIHGIWPNYFYGSYGPTHCYAPELRTEDVATMKDQLDIYWPTLKSGNTNFGFWSYQWDKHGSCWTLVNATEYFQYALDWMIEDGYRNIQHILAANGIVASNENEYLIKDINNILHDAFDQNITVKCKYGHKYISEFYACRSWFGDKIDCPNTLKSSCPEKVMLILQMMPTTTTTTTVTTNEEQYIAFAIQWKPQMCYKSWASNCHNESVGNITIHGIWPNYYSGKYPAYCSGAELQKEDVQSMRDELDIYWPTLKNGGENFDFWSYEWDKHGTCWTLVNTTEYFAFALDWMIVEGYKDIQYILAANDIIASNENIYLLENVTNALSEGLGQKSVVKCKNGKYIVEFFVCRDYYGKKMDCPNVLTSNCADEVILSLQVLPNDYYTPSPTNGNGSYSADDLMVFNKVQYDNSYHIQTFLLISFIIVAVWIVLKQWKKFGRREYMEIKSNSKRKSMHHRVVMV